MKKKFVTICLIALISVCAKAQEYDEDTDPMPWYAECEMPSFIDLEACIQVKNPEAEINTVGESFAEFIAQFGSDSAFRRSRLGGPQGVDPESGLMDWANMIDEWGEPIEFAESFYTDKCSELFSTFYGIKEGQVLYFDSESYDCDPENPDEEAWDGGGCSFYQFLRIDGKWYLADLMTIG